MVCNEALRQEDLIHLDLKAGQMAVRERERIIRWGWTNRQRKFVLQHPVQDLYGV